MCIATVVLLVLVAVRLQAQIRALISARYSASTGAASKHSSATFQERPGMFAVFRDFQVRRAKRCAVLL